MDLNAISADSLALFLDVDGTLLEIRDRPETVVSTDDLSRLLLALHERLDGALGLISGRTIDEIDRIFAPHRFSAAGAHGVEYRIGDRDIAFHSERAVPPDVMRGLRARFDELPGTLLERKNHGFAVHFRANPAAGPAVLDALKEARSQLRGDFHILSGKMVHELVPDGFDKGTAIRHFLDGAPFAGRRPVFIGDDVTDEAGFRAVNALGGASIRVGDAAGSAARDALEDVTAVHGWLGRLLGR